MKIKIKYHLGAKKLEQYGNWIDIFPRYSYEFNAPKLEVTLNGEQQVVFDSKLIDLGISMVLPKHFEACMLPRSSTFKKQHVIQGNMQGIIDGGTNPTKGVFSSDTVSKGYSGEQDIWKFSAIAFGKTTITPDKAICQFRIQPSMNAPVWVKLKWLFQTIKFVEVDVLNGSNRKGWGHTDDI